MDFHPRTFELAEAAAFNMDAAFAWYERREPGLGTEFFRACEATISMVSRAPAMHGTIHGDVRRALLRRLPFDFFFVETPDAVCIPSDPSSP